MRPRILDLFCGAGGAAVGYHRAGFDVVGVDIAPQPSYPFEFVQDDALELLSTFTSSINGWWDEPPFDAIHASPPCQAYSALRTTSEGREYPDLVEPTRELLSMTGLPYVIENVVGAPLLNPVTICGTAVGLPIVDTEDGRRQVYRHRLFETSFPMLVPPCNHTVPALGVYGQGPWKRDGTRRGGYQGTADERREGMGIDWMNRDEIAQSIPPAYTELIGGQLMAQVLLSPEKTLTL